MTPRFPQIVLCLPLGLVTTIGIAWMAAWLPARPGARFQLKQNANAGGNSLSMVSRHSLGAERAEWTIYQRDFRSADGLRDAIRRIRLPWWWSIDPTIAVLGAAQSSVSQILDARGWPLPALRCEWTSIQTSYSPEPSCGITLPQTGAPPDLVTARALPCDPVPFGLAADTLFFAMAWFLLCFASGSARRALRRRRNLCPACGYNLRGLPAPSPCPECGSLTPTHSSAPFAPSPPASPSTSA